MYIPNLNKNGLGGGWTFLNNLLKAIKTDVQIAHSVEDCDIMFICGPTMVGRDEVELANKLGKKIIFRVDNIPEDYRNRGTAISRLKDYSKMADVVVYQSEWARNYVKTLTCVDGAVIFNGVDRDIFNKDNRTDNYKQYLYVRSSTNENKRWQEAKFFFREYWMTADNHELELIVVGNFSDYVKLYGDDFINRYKLGAFDEPIKYLGQINDPRRMAEIYKTSAVLIAPYYNDACSNTILEARACGCEIDLCLSGNSGGTPEILALSDELIGIDRMGKEYLGLFNLVMQ
ncbi:MAG TPA: hypothetical protein DEF57_01040 [Candidatus Magasanikbacteria bacterium]|nr:hypothetical protein [Candidatus Magasanikbacteria bacterium]